MNNNIVPKVVVAGGKSVGKSKFLTDWQWPVYHTISLSSLCLVVAHSSTLVDMCHVTPGDTLSPVARPELYSVLARTVVEPSLSALSEILTWTDTCYTWAHTFLMTVSRMSTVLLWDSYNYLSVS